MRHSKLTAISCMFMLILKTNCFPVLRESGCPDADVIAPCKCHDSPYTVLECQNISIADNLTIVFQNSERYTYREVHILYSNFQYLPKEMFEKTVVKNLFLKNVTLAALFDTQPEGLHMLESLYIENTRVLNSMTWDLLEPLTELRVLTIYFNSIRTLDSQFSQDVTKNLQQLTLYATDTRTIAPDTLKEFTDLTKVVMDSCQLTTLSRDIFPTPFNVQILHFNDNKLTDIPNDLFTQMPNLQTIGLRNNHISVIPEAAFDSNIARITHVWFTGNPLKCDCSLQWVIRNKPRDLRGSCNSPKRIYGRELKNLDTSDINC